MPTITNRPSTATRLRWRVVVGTQGLDPSRPSRPLAWHLADCRAPASAEAHCARGRALLVEAAADPDGHCLTQGDENCPRCANLAALAAVLEAAATPPPSPPEPIIGPVATPP